MMSASGSAGWNRLFAPIPAGFAKARFNDIESVHCAISADTMAVMVELLLVVDEVQTGQAGVGRPSPASCSASSPM